MLPTDVFLWLLLLIVAVPAAFLAGLEVGLRAISPLQIVVHNNSPEPDHDQGL